MLAHEIMTEEVITIPADAAVSEAIRAMLDHRISGLPVVDEQGRLCGVLSESDLILGEGETKAAHKLINTLVKLLTHDEVELRSAHDALAAQLAEAAQGTVRQRMTAPVYSARPDTPIEDVAALVTAHDINRVPIVDENGRVVGIISRHDLLRGMYR